MDTKMKRITLILFLALASIVHAQPPLIDLTPGGFESGHPPPGWNKAPWTQMHYFDEAVQGWFPANPEGWRYLNGWITQYGDPYGQHPELAGGTFFFTNLFVLRSPATATVWWNFIGAPAGFSLGLIHTWGRRSNGTVWEHLYFVRGPMIGEARVTVDGNTPIMSIGFYGYER